MSPGPDSCDRPCRQLFLWLTSYHRLWHLRSSAGQEPRPAPVAYAGQARRRRDLRIPRLGATHCPNAWAARRGSCCFQSGLASSDAQYETVMPRPSQALSPPKIRAGPQPVGAFARPFRHSRCVRRRVPTWQLPRNTAVPARVRLPPELDAANEEARSLSAPGVLHVMTSCPAKRSQTTWGSSDFDGSLPRLRLAGATNPIL